MWESSLPSGLKIRNRYGLHGHEKWVPFDRPRYSPPLQCIPLSSEHLYDPIVDLVEEFKDKVREMGANGVLSVVLGVEMFGTERRDAWRAWILGRPVLIIQ